MSCFAILVLIISTAQCCERILPEEQAPLATQPTSGQCLSAKCLSTRHLPATQPADRGNSVFAKRAIITTRNVSSKPVASAPAGNKSDNEKTKARQVNNSGTRRQNLANDEKQINDVLDKLERAGAQIKTLQANVKHELYQMIPDDRQTKLGFIRYRAATDGKNARFMIFFDTLIHDNLKLHRKEYFCFNGYWLREIREQTKTVIDREIVSPDEKINPFKLGEGPFPLPFGQSKKEILDNFDVKLVHNDEHSIANTIHLILIPKAKSKFNKKYKRIEFWIDNKLNLPVKVVALDRHSNLITVRFDKIKVNIKLTDNQLWVPVPKGYAYQKEPIENSDAQ